MTEVFDFSERSDEECAERFAALNEDLRDATSRAVLTVPGGSPQAPKMTLRWEQSRPFDPPPFIDLTLPNGQTVRYRRAD